MNDLRQFRFQIKRQANLIRTDQLAITDRLILARSLLENVAIFNFIQERPGPRLELFKCYGAFEWGTHHINRDFRSPRIRQRKFRTFLEKLAAKYPVGFAKYGHLIQRRVCRRLAGRNQQQFKIMTSEKPEFKARQINLMARDLASHLVTKLPFPYRIVFGKGITSFVLKYSGIDRGTYWLLADLSHGILFSEVISRQSLVKIVLTVVKVVDSQFKS